MKVMRSDITTLDVDALVNPSNSIGVMGGGVALAIKKAGGEEIEAEAMKKGPIHVGQAVATTGGKLHVKYVIHASTMEKPAERIGEENVRKAVHAALELARKLGVKIVAFPGMGTGVGGVGYLDAAKIMAHEAEKYSELEIIFVAYNEKMENAFKEAI